ncbi:hypothetical protein Q2T40_07470 [Winogradskyella maritima]|uniref:Uncharacterized protein n=1 Tax=Winogradskyella maritima TaxID=1517766 RepID=A0ABV8AKP2_9FLAO|nr:hypothetical protein [Winogradskyella maritima]
MKLRYKFYSLMLIMSVWAYGQETRVILSESIEVNKEKSVVFNLKNTTVGIEESTDGKVHFMYRLDFEGYTDKQIKSAIKEITAKVSYSGNHISLTANSSTAINPINFSVGDTKNLLLKPNQSVSKKTDSVVQISKDSLLSVIRKNRKPSLEHIIEQFAFFKGNSRNNMYNQVSKKKVDILKSKFIIKVPPFVKLNINAENSQIYLNSDVRNELNVELTTGVFRAKSLSNPYNRFKLKNVFAFEVENITGGNYTLNSVYSGKIGSLSNSKITSEFSKVKIGEIAKNNTITDFNSEYWFYNWGASFNRFDLFSEYSKIHFFYPEKNHSFKVVGNNTKNLLSDGMEINMQPTKKAQKFTMMTKEPHPGEPSSGKISFDMVHGIIYSHNDSIKIINK